MNKTLILSLLLLILSNIIPNRNFNGFGERKEILSIETPNAEINNTVTIRNNTKRITIKERSHKEEENESFTVYNNRKEKLIENSPRMICPDCVGLNCSFVCVTEPQPMIWYDDDGRII